MVHVRPSRGRLLVVAEAVVAEPEVAGVRDRLLRRALAVFSAASAMKGLKVEPGGIGAAQRGGSAAACRSIR